MNPDDLLTIAEHLASGGVRPQPGRPKQAEICRAVSATYYALFHTLAHDAANLLVGDRKTTRTKQAWRQTYRALNHGRVKTQCSNRVVNRFPPEIQNFAKLFVEMQRRRHIADYDPFAQFSRFRVSQLIVQTRSAIDGFMAVHSDDRRAFAVFVLFDLRRD